MHRPTIIIIVFSLLFFASCEDKEEIKHLNSFPRWNNSHLKSNEVFLFFTKDLGQAIFPNEQHRPLNSPKQMPAVLKIGGLSTIGSYLKITKEQFADQSLIISGPPLHDAKNSEKKNGLILSSLANLPLDATLFSHQELITSKAMEKRTFDLNWLNSNTISIKSAAPVSTWGSLNYRVIQRGPIKIGLIGIAELDNIPEEQKKALQGQYFKGPATAILKLKKELKQQGAKFNILIYNGKNSCKTKLPYKSLSFSDLEGDTQCLKESPLAKIINKLPPNLIHLVINTKGEFTRGLISQTPVLGNPKGQLYLTGAKLTFDELGKLERNRSFFIAPIKFCQKMFAALEDCQFSHSNSEHHTTRLEHLDKTAFGLIQARFLGREVQKDLTIDSIVSGTQENQKQDK